MKSTVMLVEDHAMFRQGLKMLINASGDLDVVVEAEDGVDAMSKLDPANPPNIVLVDLSLKTLSGLDLIKRMHHVVPSLFVLVVSMHDETLYAERALRIGARGYVMKEESGEVLMTAIRDVLSGNFFLSRSMHTKMLNRYVKGNSEPEGLISTLTPSEFEVLKLIASRHSSKEIAMMLHRSIKTIESHRSRIRDKLQLKDGADLMRYAYHWIEEDQFPPAPAPIELVD